jgi:hypothetical protein
MAWKSDPARDRRRLAVVITGVITSRTGVYRRKLKLTAQIMTP